MSRPNRTLALIAVPLVLGVLVLRLYLHLVNPDTDLMVCGHEVHHLFSGLLMVLPAAFALAFEARDRTRDAALVLLGAGSGMVLDEFVFLIATPGTDAAYVQATSLQGSLVMTALACVGLWAGSRRGPS